MDSIKNAVGLGENTDNQSSNDNQQSSSGGGFLGGIGDKINSAAGGGKESEKNEDYLDKGSSCHSSSPYRSETHLLRLCMQRSNDS